MKTKILLITVLALISTLHALCQIPQGFNYQAIARDASDNPIVNTSMPVRITIQSDSTEGTILWQELHSSVSTNSAGMLTLVVGRGTREAGLAMFSDIDWSVTPKFIKTEINYSGWKTMGVTQLWSVPYSMAAEELAGSVKKLTVAGETTNMEEPLFEVKNRNGQTVFAVYNEGVRAYVGDGEEKGKKGGFAIGSFDTSKGEQELFIVTADSIRAYIYDDPANKGKKGGFAIGGFDASKGLTNDYLLVSPDSVRIYLDHNNTGKGIKGGFAIGSFDVSKGPGEKYLIVSRDSVRVYIENEMKKGAKGGFAVGGFDPTKASNLKYLTVNPEKTNISVSDSLKGFSVTTIQGGANTDFMNINKINYSIGHESGLKTVPSFSQYLGRYNVFFGYRAGFNNITGYGNIFLGYESGYGTSTGSYNVYVGYLAGRTNNGGNSNTFLGYESGYSSTGSYNVYLGQGAGRYNETGTRNTYIGTQSGIEDGRYSTNPSYPPGNDNVAIGYRAGAKSWTGDKNVYIGSSAGENKFGTGRIFIGYRAGFNETGNNKLYIENSEAVSPLIWGDFEENKVKIWGDLEYSGTLTGPSDYRLKKDLNKIDHTLKNLLEIDAYYFHWQQGLIPDYTFPETRQVGIIAQDLEKAFPELVVTGYDGYKSVEYSKLAVLMIPAIRELSNIINTRDRELKELKDEIEALRKLILSLEAKIETGSR